MLAHRTALLASGQIVNPLLPPIKVLFGVVGGVVLLMIIGAVAAAVMLSRKR